MQWVGLAQLHDEASESDDPSTGAFTVLYMLFFQIGL